MGSNHWYDCQRVVCYRYTKALFSSSRRIRTLTNPRSKRGMLTITPENHSHVNRIPYRSPSPVAGVVQFNPTSGVVDTPLRLYPRWDSNPQNSWVWTRRLYQFAHGGVLAVENSVSATSRRNCFKVKDNAHSLIPKPLECDYFSSISHVLFRDSTPYFYVTPLRCTLFSIYLVALEGFEPSETFVLSELTLPICISHRAIYYFDNICWWNHRTFSCYFLNSIFLVYHNVVYPHYDTSIFWYQDLRPSCVGFPHCMAHKPNVAYYRNNMSL